MIKQNSQFKGGLENFKVVKISTDLKPVLNTGGLQCSAGFHDYPSINKLTEHVPLSSVKSLPFIFPPTLAHHTLTSSPKTCFQT